MTTEGVEKSFTMQGGLGILVHMLTLGMAAASFAYSYGAVSSNIGHLEQGRIDNRNAILALQQNDAAINGALTDLRVTIATLNSQVAALRAELEMMRRTGAAQRQQGGG